MTSKLLGLLFLVAMATGQVVQKPVVRMSIPSNDKGIVKNCGPTGFPFSMYWEPKDLNPEGKLTFYYNVTAPVPFTSGMGVLKLYLADEPEPILEMDQNLDCPYIKKQAPMVPCPLKQGDPIVGSISQTKLDILAGYKGDYRVVVSITNQDGKVILCGDMNVTVL